MKVRAGNPIPLVWLAVTGSALKVVKAYVYDAAGVAVGGVVTLAHVAHGLYRSAAVAMPGSPQAFAVIVIFEADGTTPSVDTEHQALQTLELDTASHIESLSAFLDEQSMMPARDTVTIVRGEDIAIPITVLESRDKFAPLDVSAATEIVVRLVKEDGAKLEKKLSLGQVTVNSGAAGQITVQLDAADTTLLRVSDRQNLEIAVTLGAKTRIAQCYGKINVRESIIS